MAYPVWPAGLPFPLRASFRVSGSLPVKRIKMSSGPDRVIRHSQPTIRRPQLSVILDELQQYIFWQFIDVDANAGASWVMIPVKVGNVVALHRCRILGYPSSRLVSPVAQEFSFSVETDQQVLLPESQLEGQKVSQYILSSTSIASGQTYKLEVGDEAKPESERAPMPVSYARVHQITVETGSVKVLAAISTGGIKEYITISATDAEPTVPLFIAGVSQLHLEAQEDSVVQVVGY